MSPIKILQYMYGDLPYFPYSERINRRYAVKHKYDYVIRRDTPRQDRHVCWHKIPSMIEELYDCEYLLFLDADAVFYSQELRVESELVPLLEDNLILMAQDSASESLHWNPRLPNTGVILLKNEERVKQILREWDKVSESNPETKWTWPPEQLALWHVILPRYPETFKTIHDYYLIQGRLGQYIRHFSLCSDDFRVDNMKRIYSRISLC